MYRENGGFMKPDYNEIGIDYDELMERFMRNENLLNRFFKKFLNDQTFAYLQKSYNDNNNPDYNSLMINLHTLKGLAANFSMKELYSITNTWLMNLRDGNFETNEQLYQRCLEEYTKITQGLTQIFSE